MTCEERLAAAQAKTDTLKAKMANISEKAKATRAMKKEEIAAAIDEINADLDELDAAIADDFKAFDTAMSDELDAFDAAVEGDAVAAKENIKMAKERKDSKLYAFKLKAQMKADALKEKLADKREERDKIAQEAYILDLLDYAESCQQVAFAAAIEADLALLEAAEVSADYIEKYGDIEIAEAPAQEATEAE